MDNFSRNQRVIDRHSGNFLGEMAMERYEAEINEIEEIECQACPDTFVPLDEDDKICPKCRKVEN